MQFNIPIEHKNRSGVYIIRNSINNSVYVGSTKCLHIRYLSHLSGLKTKRHSSASLSLFVNTYGIGTLSFELLELCEVGMDMVNAERTHILNLGKEKIPLFNIAKYSLMNPSVHINGETRTIGIDFVLILKRRNLIRRGDFSYIAKIVGKPASYICCVLQHQTPTSQSIVDVIVDYYSTRIKDMKAQVEFIDNLLSKNSKK